MSGSADTGRSGGRDQESGDRPHVGPGSDAPATDVRSAGPTPSDPGGADAGVVGESAPPHPCGTLAARDGARLYWTARGDTGHPVVVPGAWMLADALGGPPDGQRYLSYDMRSRGRSERIDGPDRLGFDLDVRDLEDVRRRFGAERMSLVGFSYLGGVVARYAMAHPERVRRLVLLGAIPPRAPTDFDRTVPSAREVLDREAVERLRRLRTEGLPERDPAAFCRAYWRIMLPAYTGTPKAAERLAGSLDLGCGLENERPDAFQRVLGPVMAALDAYDWRGDARRLEAPTLVLHGVRDHVAPVEGAREWADVLPRARLEAVENAGHLLWAERPERVGGAVRSFLEGGEGT